MRWHRLHRARPSSATISATRSPHASQITTLATLFAMAMFLARDLWSSMCVARGGRADRCSPTRRGTPGPGNVPRLRSGSTSCACPSSGTCDRRAGLATRSRSPVLIWVLMAPVVTSLSRPTDISVDPVRLRGSTSSFSRAVKWQEATTTLNGSTPLRPTSRQSSKRLGYDRIVRASKSTDAPIRTSSPGMETSRPRVSSLVPTMTYTDIGQDDGSSMSADTSTEIPHQLG